LSLRSLPLSKRDMFFLIIFLDAPYHDSLTKAESHQAMWLIENRHGIQWEDGMVPYCMARSLITKAVMGTTTTNDDDDDIVVYVKGHEKREFFARFAPG